MRHRVFDVLAKQPLTLDGLAGDRRLRRGLAITDVLTGIGLLARDDAGFHPHPNPPPSW